MTTDLISVFVPIYNGENFIEHCVANLQAQTYSKNEIILVDDGSRDNSYSICCQLANADPRIKAKHMDNLGQGMARNIDIEMANREYIGFCDVYDLTRPFYV